MLGITLLIVLIALLAVSVLTWRHLAEWGYGLSYVITALLVIVLVQVLRGRI